MLNFIKFHWFGLLISLFIGLFLLQFLIVMISPHYDLQNRGFAYCTDKMAQRIEDCQSANLCIFKTVISGSFCDTEVIIKGFSEWIKGKQPRPWSNYIFVPEYPDETEEADEALEEYYNNNPDLYEQMDNIRQQYLELEKKNDEARKSAVMESE